MSWYRIVSCMFFSFIAFLFYLSCLHLIFIVTLSFLSLIFISSFLCYPILYATLSCRILSDLIWSLSLYLSTSLSLSLYLSVSLSIYLSMYLYIYLSLSPYTYMYYILMYFIYLILCVSIFSIILNCSYFNRLRWSSAQGALGTDLSSGDLLEDILGMSSSGLGWWECHWIWSQRADRRILLGVSWNGATPNSWMVYKGKSHQNGWWLGVPLF